MLYIVRCETVVTPFLRSMKFSPLQKTSKLVEWALTGGMGLSSIPPVEIGKLLLKTSLVPLIGLSERGNEYDKV